MKHNVVKLLKQPGLKETIRFQEALADMEFMGGVLRFVEPVALEASLVYDGEGFDAAGTVRTMIQSECARCLAPVNLPVTVAFQERFVKGEGDPAQEAYCFAGDELDFSELVRDCLLLNLPMSTLCSDSCKGLCPVCGCDRNESDCSCGEQESGQGQGLSRLKTLLDENKEV